MNQASYKVEGSSQFLFSIYILCPEFTSKSLKQAHAKYEQAIDLLPKKTFQYQKPDGSLFSMIFWTTLELHSSEQQRGIFHGSLVFIQLIQFSLHLFV